MNTEVQEYLKRFDQILYQMSCKMLGSTITGNITNDFIKCMIPHHQAAIYMCENLLKFTNYEPLIKVANNIIKEQTEGIEQMKNIEKETQVYKNSQKEVAKYFERYLAITENMIYKMGNAPRGENINLNFVNEMIPHHEGAIYMCKNLLKYNINPQLIQVANSIIKEQTEGVKQMKEIRKNLQY